MPDLIAYISADLTENGDRGLKLENYPLNQEGDSFDVFDSKEKEDDLYLGNVSAKDLDLSLSSMRLSFFLWHLTPGLFRYIHIPYSTVHIICPRFEESLV